ncbi:MAG: aglZ, partial [Myxococcaceae bacterium]|nr:aglZ [Myxococcaceae bacterium]
LEGASSTKAKGEKELGAKVAVAEAKANDAATKLQSLMREKKELEGKHLLQMEELGAKQKAELDRREQVKAQEVQRLQAAVQEKSKALKVVELELARYKNKPAAGAARPAAAKPAESKGSSIAAAFEEGNEDATRANVIPVEMRAPAAHAAHADSGMRTEAVRVPPKTQPGTPGRAAATTQPSVPVPKPAAGPLLTAAVATKRPPEREERTVVMPAGTVMPAKKKAEDDDEADFTSLIDNLGD